MWGQQGLLRVVAGPSGHLLFSWPSTAYTHSSLHSTASAPPPSRLFQLLTAMGPRTPRSDSHVLVSAQSRLPNLRTAYPTASSWWHECAQGASQRC